MNDLHSKLKDLKICYFGHFDPDYSRNRILMKALRRAGAEVIQVRDSRRFPFRHFSLFHKALRREFDLLIVGFPGHTDMALAKLVALKKGVPLIFDAFISLFDSNVFDRACVSENSVAARQYFITDKLSATLADIVLLDTNAHISYFVETFGIPRKKFRRVWVGADDEIMYPRTDVTQSSKFTVFFYGSFIKLHGIDYIIKAARILKLNKASVRFIIAGSGSMFPRIRQLADELRVKDVVTFLGWVRYEQLPVLMSQSHLCLGIFGTTPKAQRVIPNKVFDALAVQRPVITACTPAVKEAGLSHGDNIWFCPAGDAKALADAILTLRKSDCLRERISRNGFLYFRKHLSINYVAEDLVDLIDGVFRDDS